jgi:hypothetical protein
LEGEISDVWFLEAKDEIADSILARYKVIVIFILVGLLELSQRLWLVVNWTREQKDPL